MKHTIQYIVVNKESQGKLDKKVLSCSWEAQQIYLLLCNPEIIEKRYKFVDRKCIPWTVLYSFLFSLDPSQFRLAMEELQQLGFFSRDQDAGIDFVFFYPRGWEDQVEDLLQWKWKGDVFE